MQKITRTIITAAATVLAACSGGVPAHTTERANLFASKEEAYQEHSLNHPVPVPIATLGRGAHVTVLSDTYEKNYWACYVRTDSSVKGWVLCTSLDYKAPE
jgi:hypothetical protein